jgi:hypothetical protein
MTKVREFTQGTYNNILTGMIPVGFREIEEPKVSWIGKKLAFEQWRQLISWFRENRNRECVAYLLYSHADGIRLYIPRQQGTSGSVRVENTEKELLELLSTHFILGNIHTHPQFEAFQSSIDAKEEQSDGIYFTIGRVDSRICTWHSRTVLSGYTYNNQPSLMDLIEYPVVQTAPIGGLEEIFLLQTLILPKYPVEWNSKLIIEPPVSVTSAFSYPADRERAGDSSLVAPIQGVYPSSEPQREIDDLFDNDPNGWGRQGRRKRRKKNAKRKSAEQYGAELVGDPFYYDGR